MSNRAYLPRAQAAIVGAQGIPTSEFYDFLLRLAAGTEDANLQAQILALAARVATLEAEGGDIGNVQGLNSILTFGNLNDGTVTVTLAGDELNPAATYYYGTNALGEKGWHAVAGTIEVAADELTKAVAADGVTTFGLADVAPTAGGTLQKYGFDAKGRRGEEEAATTDDLAEGATNLYFTDERAQDAVVVPTITNGDTTHAPSGDAVFDALAGKDDAGSAAAALAAANTYTDGEIATREPLIVPGTDSQVWRGDKTWGNWINGDWRVGTSSGLFGSGRELAISAGVSANNIAHLSLQGSRTINGVFATTNYYHQATLVVSMGAARDGADDAGYWVISTRPAGGPLTNRMRILGDGSIIIGAGAVSNGAGVMQFAGNAVPFTNNGGTCGEISHRWSATYTTRIDAAGAVVCSGILTPATLAASANDYAPTGHLTAYVFRLAASVAVNLTGMQGGEAGRKIMLMNIGANNIILSHDSGSSAAANRWLAANNTSVTLRQNGMVEAVYDPTSQRWRIIGA